MSLRDRQKLGDCHPASAAYVPCNTWGCCLGCNPMESPKLDLNSLRDRSLHYNSYKAAYTFLFCLFKNYFPLLLRSHQRGLGRHAALVLNLQNRGVSPQFGKSPQICSACWGSASRVQGYGAHHTQPHDLKPINEMLPQSEWS